MKFVPATLPLGVQVSPAILRLMAVFTMVGDGLIQIGLGLLNGMLAFRSIIGMQARSCT